MAKDQIRYDILIKDALRSVIRKVLSDVAKTGLPDNHHFFITFLTDAPGVKLSPHLKKLYPQQMTIVLQHQFWDLNVTENTFEVSLSFSNIPEKLIVPFDAIQVFFDPIAAFEATFELPKDASNNNNEVFPEPSFKTKNIPNPLKKQNIEATADIKEKSENTNLKTTTNENKRTAQREKKQSTTSKNSADVVSLEAFRKNKE